MGFRYKKSTDSSWYDIVYTEGITTANGSFSLRVDNLASSQTYDYEAYMHVWNGSGYVEIVKSGQFTTEAAAAFTPTGWLELPATTGGEDLVITMYKSGGVSGLASDRNYTMNYSKERYAALWVAYTLTEADVVTGNTSSGNWSINNSVFSGGYQVGVTQSIGSYPSNYANASSYSRGHQIPSADRTTSNTANAQTYLLTNQTPQRQNKFNGSIWGSLETAGRGFVVTENSKGNANYNGSFKKTDVLYIITGPSYGKEGTSETPEYLVSNGSVSPESVPIPIYYWKVFLKVRMNGDVVDQACAIGFWLEHRDYEGESYTSYVKSVNQIEAWTGFDLFANLPDGMEEAVEANTNWTTFRDF